MARPLRLEFEGALYHVISRGNARQKIFRADTDYQQFLRILGGVVERFTWLIHAYCLLDNHYHLLVETPHANLSAGMRQLNGTYAQYFSRRHNRPGHLFQGRFKAYVVDRDSYLSELSRYIALNPVRAGLAASPGKWKWSSYRKTAGLDKGMPFLHTEKILANFSTLPEEAQKLYLAFVADGLESDDPLKNAKGGILLGSDDFVSQFREWLGQGVPAEIPHRERHAVRPSLPEIFRVRNRNEGIREAINRWGFKLKEVGDYLGLHYSRVSKIAGMKEKAKGKT
ncbi:MAG TPA: transposase [Syntrophales bacterium]|nr:transposase [Syntrophales bacterium]HRT62212.1 transposase [Syntrophales bacterium]